MRNCLYCKKFIMAGIDILCTHELWVELSRDRSAVEFREIVAHGARCNEFEHVDEPDKKKSLTAEEKKKYINDQGFYCPWCGARELDYAEMSVRGAQIKQGAFCTQCDKEWVDVFKLIDLEEIDEQPQENNNGPGKRVKD